jgi:hypothetical protein
MFLTASKAKLTGPPDFTVITISPAGVVIVTDSPDLRLIINIKRSLSSNRGAELALVQLATIPIGRSSDRLMRQTMVIVASGSPSRTTL